MDKKTQLHAILAVESDLVNTAKAIADETMTTFNKKPEHFRGYTKTVSYYDEQRRQEDEAESKEMVTTVDEKFEHTTPVLARLYDALLQKEEANQRAKADLVVDGVVIGEGLPATFLLGMETRLKSVRSVVAAAPTLDPSIRWTPDEDAGSGRFRSEPQMAKRTEKTVEHKILVPATDRHPAQVEKWTQDVPVARIETVHKSGMWTPAEKSAVLARIDRMIAEVKRSRQMANTVEVADLHVAKKMFDYIFA